MIKAYDRTPEVYYKRSRDFQLLGRIHDIVFNYAKMNADLIGNISYADNIDDKLLPLLCTTLGFKEMHEYNLEQLKGLCSIFVNCLRHKGTLKSVQDLLNLLVNVENEKEKAVAEVDFTDPYLLNIYFPTSISDTSLFEDVLTYILPAGMTYRIVNQEREKYDLPGDEVYLESDDKAFITIKKATHTYMAQMHEGQKSADSTLEESSIPERGRIEDVLIPRVEKDTDVEDETGKPTKIYPEGE